MRFRPGNKVVVKANTLIIFGRGIEEDVTAEKEADNNTKVQVMPEGDPEERRPGCDRDQGKLAPASAGEPGRRLASGDADRGVAGGTEGEKETKL